MSARGAPGRAVPAPMQPEPHRLGALAREHLDSPRNAGPFRTRGQGEICSGEAGSRRAGEFVRFHLRIVRGAIAEARFEALGEPALIAAASYLSTRLPGLRAQAGCLPSGLEIARTLELPRSHHGAALLAEDAVRAALDGMPRRAERG